MARRRVVPNETQTPKPTMRVRQSGPVLISLILVAVSCWMLTNLVGQVLTGMQIDKQKADLEAEVTSIEHDNTDLKDQVTYSESPAYADKIAREQLGMARDGDTVILPTFPDLKAPTPTPKPTAVPPPTPERNWKGWKQALFPPSR